MSVEDLLARSLIAIALAVGGFLAFRVWRGTQLRRVREAGPTTPGLAEWQYGRRAILYFTTPDCAPCRTTQRPTLRRLESELGDAVQVIEINAAEERAIADHWGVLSVPTTFVLGEDGRPRHVNIGVVGMDQLKRQLEIGPSQ